MPLFVAVCAELLLYEIFLPKYVCFSGHALARGVEGMAGAGSRAGGGERDILGRLWACEARCVGALARTEKGLVLVLERRNLFLHVLLHVECDH